MSPNKFSAEEVIYDDKNIIKEIRWSNKGVGGHLNVQFLPPGVEHFDASNNSIVGPIEFGQLPPQIVSFDMSNNNIEQDVIELSELPSTLEIMDFTGNRIKQIISKDTGVPIDDPRVWW